MPWAEQKRDHDLVRVADAWEYQTAWERCITRGVPGGIFPASYNSGYRIVQTPGYVVIHYEMIHEARIIPLDGRPHAPAGIRLWNARTGQQTQTLKEGNVSFKWLAFSPDGKTLAAGGQDKVIRLWDVAGGKVIKKLVGHSFEPSRLPVDASVRRADEQDVEAEGVSALHRDQLVRADDVSL